MDRAPKAAPFPVGARVRYLGESRTWVEVGGAKIPLIEPDIEVTICGVRPGRRGTLRHCRDYDGFMYYEDSGEPILDETDDGYSIYYTDQDADHKYGRIIRVDDVDKWTVVA